MINLPSVFVELMPNGTSAEGQIAVLINVITRTVLISYSVLIAVIGIPGNVLAINILRRKALHQSFLSGYLIYLALLNIACLLIGMSRLFILGLLDYNYRQISPEICFIHTWMTMTSVNVCNWHLVLITFGRWLYLRYPVRSARLFKGWRMYTSMFFTLFVTACLQGMVLYMGVAAEEFTTLFEENQCHFQAAYGMTLATEMVTCFLPLAFLILFSIQIFYDVKFKSRGTSLGTTVLHQNRRAARDKNLAILLLVINIQFFVTNVPIATIYLTAELTFDKRHVIDYELSNLAIAAGRMLLYGGYATNCIIYCLFGSRFRNEIVKYLFDKGFCPRNFQRDYNTAARSAWTSAIEHSIRRTSDASPSQPVDPVETQQRSLEIITRQTTSYSTILPK